MNAKVHFTTGKDFRLDAACGTERPIQGYTTSTRAQFVTCPKCKRTTAYKAAKATQSRLA